MNARPLATEKGYTLAELLVVLVIFGIVLTLTTASFNRIVLTSGQTIRSSETEIEGLIGLEVLRADLELAGFGLPWSFQNDIVYSEAASVSGTNKPPDPAPYNDAPNHSPRAIVSGDNVGFNHSDYLVLKGSALGSSDASRKTSYMTYGPVVRATKNGDTDLRLGSLDKAIALNATTRSGVGTRELVMNGAQFFFPFDSLGHLVQNSPAFLPKALNDNYLVYGLLDGDSSSDPAAPFNRADYYLFRPDDINSRCAPQTAVLYKGILNPGGSFQTLPLLECVADLQVVYGFTQDSRLNGTIDLHDDKVTGFSAAAATARDIRDQVREVRVYVLAHEGKMDRDYVYPKSTVPVGEFGHGSLFDLPAVIGAKCPARQPDCWKHYRWKVYTIVVNPKNLN
ncbi:prepilin-type N-terminal cleavage/methylation domain-containing protein [Geomesophilobacter sediminis]|uniref:Type II secretion system protein n=1 Tax=Geomesophilobacter sediminis TaxID=2798584 RepID=A0A8J7M2C1_9BACT|nr:prepilin-type N-terminal cleavage/methylation domain-containing protein [Geomesophilobacter sediminis]MBJ6727444.1 type II secretion system protein [Geomesophilobacter sediminis]